MTGCTQISAGCDHCYAKTLAERKLKQVYLAQPPVKNTSANRVDPFAPRYWGNRLDQPLRWRTPMRIFVNSMSDVFHAQFSLEQIRKLFEVMHEAHWHQFQVLTKRPERAVRLADELPWGTNVWLGTSIEDMRVARRADALRAIQQPAVKFISAEPLLGSLADLNLDGIDWVIGGGESGGGFRPCDPEWARELRDRCVALGIAFFWKQWGGATPKAGGRQLDGRFWDEYPVPLVSAAV